MRVERVGDWAYVSGCGEWAGHRVVATVQWI